MSIGTGFMILVSSLVITSFSDEMANIVYSLMNMLGVIASAITPLIYSAVFRIGLKYDPWWYGLPYLAAACILFLACGITILAAVCKAPDDEYET
jgi:MFS family permease